VSSSERAAPGAPGLDWLGLALSAGPLLILVGAIVLAPQATKGWIDAGFGLTTWALGALWQGVLLGMLVLALGVALSPWGRARLGGADARPVLGFVPWLAVILCTLLAGGGVFFSAAEPVYHLLTPPPAFPGVEGGTHPALVAGLAQAFLHWGFLAWAVVGTLPAIALSAAHTLRDQPLRPRTLLEPILGARLIAGPVGAVIDAIGIVAVVAGTVGPIGFLALQLGVAGEILLGLQDGVVVQLGALALLVGLYTASAVTGLTRGIAWLSRANVVLALALGAALLVVGPTLAQITLFGESLWTHLTHFGALATSRADPAWQDGWTLFYWGWFLGYAPLMAVFTASASRGRTVRELVLAVALGAPLVTMLWFTALGGTAGLLELSDPGVISDPLGERGMGAALLATLQALPYAWLLIPTALVLIFCFLATTGDSMAYAISVVQARRPEPPAGLRVFWALLMGALAAALLSLGGGGIDALQRFIVIAAAPVTLLVLPTLVTGPLGARDLWRAAASGQAPHPEADREADDQPADPPSDP